jgi:ankyrin repeat protein
MKSGFLVFILGLLFLPLTLYSADIFESAKSGDLTMVKNYIENVGMDVNKPDAHGWTALHYAVRNYQYETVKYLLEKKGRCQRQDSLGECR